MLSNFFLFCFHNAIPSYGFLSQIYVIHINYSMVGRSIADISDRGGSAKVNMPPRSDTKAMDRPTVLCDISYGECATDEPFCMRRQNIIKTTPFFSRRSIPLI